CREALEHGVAHLLAKTMAPRRRGVRAVVHEGMRDRFYRHERVRHDGAEDIVLVVDAHGLRPVAPDHRLRRNEIAPGWIRLRRLILATEGIALERSEPPRKLAPRHAFVIAWIVGVFTEAGEHHA